MLLSSKINSKRPVTSQSSQDFRGNGWAPVENGNLNGLVRQDIRQAQRLFNKESEEQTRLQGRYIKYGGRRRSDLISSPI